jgi:excisionase family DNA binding protein
MSHLTIQEAAQRLRVHPRTVRKYIQEGKLGSTLSSAGNVGVDEDELRAFSGEKTKPRAIKSALDTFLDHDYSGELGDVRCVGIVDVFCDSRQEAVALAEHVTDCVVYGGGHGDHGADDCDGHFEFHFLSPQAKARFVLYGSPVWQAQALYALGDMAQMLHPPVTCTENPTTDRYGYSEGESTGEGCVSETEPNVSPP